MYENLAIFKRHYNFDNFDFIYSNLKMTLESCIEYTS